MTINGLVPALHTKLWESIRKRLEAPDFVHTRRVGLIAEPCIPSMLDYVHTTHTHYDRSRNAFYYFFESATKTKRLTPVFDHRCPTCYSTDLRIHDREAIVVCKGCGCSHPYHDPTASSYTQSFGSAVSSHQPIPRRPRTHTTCWYKRCNHFRYWLARLQGKERNRLTSNILADIKSRLDQQHMSYSYYHIRQCLKQLNLNRFYNNTYAIQRSLTGRGLFTLSHSQEKRLLNMFISIQPAFARHAGGRVNMLYYAYVLRKLTEILGWTTVARSLPTLKSPARIAQLDAVWKEVCQDAGLVFVRTI